MSDNGRPVPPPSLLAQAAAILGVDDGSGPAGPPPPAGVMVTVAGPDQRKVMQVPLGVPAGELAARLGAAVGVTVISRVSVAGGPPVPPGETFAEAGVRAGSVIHIDAPNSRRLTVAPAAAGPPLPHPSRPAFAPHMTPRRRSTRQWVGATAGVLALIAASMAIGAAAFGGDGSSATTTGPDSARALAAKAATAWVSGARFDGARAPAVPAGLGRSGPANGGTVQAIGSSASAGITDVLFIITPPGGAAPYGLSVVIYRRAVAYPPTLAPLPFATSIPSGGAAFVPQTGKIVPPSAGKMAGRWASSVLGSPANPGALPGYGTAGPPKVLDEWQPAAGADRVARIQVPLAGPSARDLTVSRALATRDTAAVTAAQNAAASETAAVTAAQAAAAKAAPAGPAAAAAANKQLAASRRALDDAQNALAAAQQIAAQDTARTMTQPPGSTITAVYDVAFNPQGEPTAWAPADYLIGHS